ncbi:MAG TPA: ABC transporter permease [Candidatus Acidoferrum sp.]|jgi:putative ABC transport system permease protein|nr:ABC transporter permease [Candidatus Acidoferrum sp.]
MRPEHWLSTIPLRLRSLFRWAQADQELDDELRDQLERRTEGYVAQGMAPEEAQHRARLDLGGIEQTKEKCRDTRGVNWIQDFGQDLHFSLRILRKSPGFTAVAILTLGLGLAANTAIFSVINGVILQPLEFPNPSELVAIELFVPKLAQKLPMVPVNPAAYLGWSSQAKSLAGIGLVEDGVTLNLTSGGEPTLLSADAVTANLFDVLGVTPFLGRNLSPDADQAGHNHEVILTNALWRNRFRGDPNIIGQAIALNGSPYTVVGVLPPTLHFPRGDQLTAITGSANEPEVFVPEVFEQWELDPGAGFGFAAIARLKTGVSAEQATTELNVILGRELGSQSFMPNSRTVMMPLRDMIVGSTARGLWMLLAAVLAVLLIICVNLANLVLTRATAREQEAAIRRALGASRGRLLRQTLVETLLLGLLGGTLGLVLAHWALWGLLAVAPVSVPRLHNVRLDSAVVGFTLVISVLAGVLAGLLPAWRAARTNPQDALQAGARSADSRMRLRAREFLVGLETALSAMLLVAAGLLVASFAKLVRVPEGFAVEHILTVNLQLPEGQYPRSEQRTDFWRRLLASTSELPGVESAAVTNLLPLKGEWNNNPVNLPGDTRPVAERPFARYRRITPEYFKTFGIPLLNGRELAWADAGTPAVVISDSTGKTVWPGLNPIGQRFDVDVPSGFPGYQVVGVVGDTRVSLFKAPAPMVYVLYESGLTGSLILRTRLPATAVAPELHGAIWKIDPSVAIPSISSMGQIVSESLAPQRFETLLTSLFATAALLLACLGIYGVVSYSVVRRTREIGIRMALGAQKADMLRRVVSQGMTPVLLGLGAGIIGALGFTRLLSSLLYGVNPTDPLTFAVVSLILAGVALLACYVPARRAMRVDPMVALRYE